MLAELKEYAQEVDVDFVRKAVACIGQVARREAATAQPCVEALLELLPVKVAYVVQEAIVVLRVRALARLGAACALAGMSERMALQGDMLLVTQHLRTAMRL